MPDAWIEKHPRAKTKIIRALKPQIAEKTAEAVEEIRPTIARSTEDHEHLQDSLHTEDKSWGTRVVFGVEERPEAAPNYEFGNLSGQDGERPLLRIRQRIERG